MSAFDPGAQVFASVAHEVTWIAELSEGDRRELLIAIRAGVRLLDDTVEPLTDVDLHGLRNGVRVLVRVGLPLVEFVRCQELCVSRAMAIHWQAADLTRPAALTERLHRVGRRWRDLSADLLRLFLEESAAVSGVPAAPQVAHAILDGSLTPSLAAACGLPPSVDGYLVAALPAGPEVVGPLTETGQPDLLWRYRRDELVLLAPVTAGVAGVDTARSRIGDTLRALLPMVAAPAVGVFRHQHQAAEALGQSRQLRAFAVAAGLTDVLHAPEDLAVDRGVARVPRVGAGLRALVAPLGTELRRTLRALYRVDLHRARAAEVLGVHRQTLTYRLNRVRELTGIDPLSVRGVTVLAAALAADTRIPRR